MAEKEIKKIALIISGGTCRGAAQVAFVNELIKKVGLDRICVISASSIGSLTAYATSVGRTEQLIEAFRNLDCDNTRHFIKKVKNDLFNDTFNLIESDIKVPTYLTVTRVWGLDCGYYCINHMPRKDLKACINASMALPIVNGPLRFSNHLCLDGGATDNIPVYPATYYDPDMVIIIHCFSRYYPPRWIYESFRKDVVVVDLDISLNFPDRFSPFSFSKTDFEYLTGQGKADGLEFVDAIFPNSDFDTENVRARCFKYINDHMELRHKKTWNGYMDWVEVLNALYQIKEGLV
jgi:Predicted esterase of the alpha-beta hydrolase superfamily